MQKKNNGHAEASANASRRADLICAAARLMRNKGYAATTTREMAKAVGMSSGSPFCHFRSKQEILAEIVVNGMENALARAEQVAALRLSQRRRLRELIRLHLEILHGPEGDFSAVMFREWRTLAPEIRRRLTSLMERYEAIWRDCLRGMKQAHHLSADADMTARLILGSLNWSIHWFRRGGTFDAERLAEVAAAIFLATTTEAGISRATGAPA